MKKKTVFPFPSLLDTSQSLEKEMASLFVPASDDSPPFPYGGSRKRMEEDQTNSHFYLTVYMKIRMNRKHLSLVSGLFLRGILKTGINVNDFLVLEFLLDQLLGQKLRPEELKVERELVLALCFQSIFFSLKELSLGEERIELPEEIKLFIDSCKYVPSERTAGSWMQTYPISKFLFIRAVRVEDMIERSSSTIPYDSYCKGYGESHPSQHKIKTKPSAELDGEEVDLIKEGSISIPLLSVQFFLQYQELEMKYLKYLR